MTAAPLGKIAAVSLIRDPIPAVDRGSAPRTEGPPRPGQSTFDLIEWPSIEEIRARHPRSVALYDWAKKAAWPAEGWGPP